MPILEAESLMNSTCEDCKKSLMKAKKKKQKFVFMNRDDYHLITKEQVEIILSR